MLGGEMGRRGREAFGFRSGADVGVVLLVPAESASCPRAGVAYADTACKHDTGRGRTRAEEEGWVCGEVEPIVIAGDGEGLAEFAGA
jgi:hypothetical protein